MLRINRVQVNIKAQNRNYGFDQKFGRGLNFIASDDNTKGKSSVLIAIYYCLGVEEIIGGVNEKVLTSVYKTKIEDEDKNAWAVLESEAVLEITNGEDTISILRTAKSESKNSKLVTVFYSSIDDMYDEKTSKEEFYVHMPYAATNAKGFHSFLEKFIGMTLPTVPSSDGTNHKLYIQLLFSAMFIEQKNGWSGIFSGMPYLPIKDAKKRVVEYLLGLTMFENEKRKNQLDVQEKILQEEWRKTYNDVISLQTKNQCLVINFPPKPEILSLDYYNNIHIVRSVGEQISLESWIEELKEEYNSYRTIKPRIIDNFDELQEELKLTEDSLIANSDKEKEIQEELRIVRRKIIELQNNLKTISQDIVNNKDTLKLQKLGGTLHLKAFAGVCPTCNQEIQDSLLPEQHLGRVMSVEESLKHLTAQKDTLEFALDYNIQRKSDLEELLQDVRNSSMNLYRLAKTIRTDLFSVDDDYSETMIYKRMAVQQHIDELKTFSNTIKDKTQEIIDLSEKWRTLLSQRASLPPKGLSQADAERIKTLEECFKSNLIRFKYTSIANVESIELSKDNYQPVIDNFDMKFDSSASDNIRAIWAYTLALIQTSKEHNGNHPGILVFDEPAQHSIGAEDTEAFINSILELGEDSQVIVGITINNSDIRKTIESIGKEKYTFIHIGEKAFT